jgi:peptidoglycan-associated lipoprotein
MIQMNLAQPRSLAPTSLRYRFTTLLIAACAVSVLAACTSPIKLNEVTVEDRSGTAPGAMPANGAAGAGNANGSAGTTAATVAGGAAGTDLGQRAVQQATLDGAQAGAAGPANAAKIIYFDYDSYAIRPEFQTAIDNHAKFLSVNKGRKLAIEGHTDERGGREYNLALGQKRSEAVRRALALLGVTESQVEAVSFGKEKPASLGLDESSMALNRRAEINYR